MKTMDHTLGIHPGLRWGLLPQRRPSQAAWYAPIWQRGWQQRPATLDLMRAQPVRQHQQAWLALSGEAASAGVQRLRSQLGAAASPAERAALLDDALGCVAARALQVLGRDPFDTQLVCAQALLQGRMVEMATGEGKSLAVALAAAVAALMGSPVHVMTANDYLGARDAQASSPLMAALSLRVGVIVAGSSPDERRAAYAADITFATAREIAFDSLRDGLQGRRPDGRAAGDLSLRAAALAGNRTQRPLQRGLCCALIDEADSLLIDEAQMPLVLAQPEDDSQRRAACFQALALARQLQLGADALLDLGSQAVHWTPAGQSRLDALTEGLDGAWLNRRHRQDLTAQALVALHALQAGRDYLLIDGRVELLDRVSGRRATGRVWSRQLQTLVELKEGCKLSPATQTAAQTSYQRFFARYHHLAGTSGTLRECRGELASIYGCRVARVPLRRPDRRTLLPTQLFATGSAREAGTVQRVRQLQQQGRPVLVGVASVAAAMALSQALEREGIEHRVLDARTEQDEAPIVAAAGQAAAVTVATAMAGRGTDIELGPGVSERGGLHVLNLMDSPCARTVRQLVGRAARQGDPGSAETWHAADSPLWNTAWLRHVASGTPHTFVQAASRLQQRWHGWQSRQQRRRILEQDLSWERRLAFRMQHA